MELPVIDFEGIDGAGKSYALDHLKAYYEAKKIPVVVVPSISLHEFIDAHDSKWYDITNDTTRFATYLTYELNSYYKNIKPNIGKRVVLIDRYIPSCLAYNRLYKNLDEDFKSFIFKMITTMLEDFFIPDVTFIFDVSDTHIIKRFEVYRQDEKPPNLAFTQAVRDGYRDFKLTYGRRWNIKSIDGSKDIKTIVQDMVSTIDNIKEGAILQ